MSVVQSTVQSRALQVPAHIQEKVNDLWETPSIDDWLNEQLKGKGKGKMSVDKVRKQDMYGDEWWIYVRRYCDALEDTEQSTADIVQLNRELLKFGITGVLSMRSTGYSADRGYFVYAFRCKNFSEAKKVESIICAYFKNCKFQSKQEYLKVIEAAGVLGIYIDQAGATEQQYADFALHLYAKIVKTLHDLNPEHKGK